MGKLYNGLSEADKLMVDLAIAVNENPKNTLFAMGADIQNPEFLDNYRESLSAPDILANLKASEASTREEAIEYGIDPSDPLKNYGHGKGMASIRCYNWSFTTVLTYE